MGSVQGITTGLPLPGKFRLDDIPSAFLSQISSQIHGLPQGFIHDLIITHLNFLNCKFTLLNKKARAAYCTAVLNSVKGTVDREYLQLHIIMCIKTDMSSAVIGATQ